MAGTIIIWAAFAASLLSAYAYYQASRGRMHRLRLARNSFAVAALSVVTASGLLLSYILTHRFEYAYVFGYSSRSLPIHLLLSTFWAGQEGSFLFWALCSAVIGMFLMAYTRRKGVEFESMTIYALLQAFLLLLMIVKSPFEFVWDANPGQFAAGAAPVDGRGLNPLLQNFWMIVHPPVLFVGFAAMAVPFTLALAALWRRTYRGWIAFAFPWILFATIALGAGIIIGGYWAYGVLGWGGWWGWDPVENSSLIPWIVAVALIHTILVQKKTGGMARVNFLLAILSYILVIYSTFLTRSGILGSSSVHSFVDPGALAYTLLLVWILSAALFGFWMLAKRWGELRTAVPQPKLFTRESFLTLSSAVMGASALVIFFGTSWPILSNASLEPSFYDRMNLPVAIALALLLGLGLLVRWNEESLKTMLKGSILPAGLSAGGTAVLIALGLDDFLMALFAFTSLFAFSINVQRAYRLGRESIRFMGGAVAHIGLALLFLGIIGSGHYGRKETIALPLNHARQALGYTLTYTGAQPTDDGKWKFVVRVEGKGSAFELAPVMYESSYNNSIMRSPDYVSFLTGDVYLEPVSLEQKEINGGMRGHSFHELEKGMTKRIGATEVTFLRFDMEHEGMQSMMGGEGFAVGAVLRVEREGKVEEVVPVTVYKEGHAPQMRSAATKDGQIAFQLLGMNVDSESKTSLIQINITGLGGAEPAPQKTESLVVEASVKPFMGLVWLAAVLITAGLFISISGLRGGEIKKRNVRASVSAGTAAEARRGKVEARAEELAEEG